jgi:cAMP phosphodiesterase
MKMRSLLLLLFLFSGMAARSQDTAKYAFVVVPLGIKGGSDESNLSAYLVAAKGTDSYLCLDAGTLHYGIQKAVERGVFSDSAGHILKNNVKAYLISHPHLDHVAGLIINSPDDGPKNIYGLPFCLDILKSNYFTWKSWANFADDGDKPLLKKYHYVYLAPETEVNIDHTEMQVTAFPLSHSTPYQSTAFLIRHQQDFLLYLGDTGSDTLEKSGNLRHLWEAISPLLREGKLKAIFIETSFPDEQPQKQLFGHLTPKLLLQEMKVLGGLAGNASLQGVSIVITHMKPTGNNEAKIKQELTTSNTFGLRLIFPEQATPLHF